jgi:hypothetical protein
MTDEITITLANGTSIQECVRKVKMHCEKVPAYEIYDRIASPQEDSITILDICLANNIDARISASDIREFWRYVSDHRVEIEQGLSRIPQNVDLHQVDEDTFFDNLRTLFALFFNGKEPKVRNVNFTRVTKILHKKRPRAIPIVDRKTVIENYIRKGSSWLGTSNSADYLLKVTKIIRQDILRNLNELQEIQRGLQPDEGGDLTLLRIFDILLYQRSQEQSQ